MFQRPPACTTEQTQAGLEVRASPEDFSPVSSSGGVYLYLSLSRRCCDTAASQPEGVVDGDSRDVLLADCCAAPPAAPAK